MRSLLLRCYPEAWRARYAEEFAAVLEEASLGPLDVVDILIGAMDAQLRLRGRDTTIAHGKGFIMPLRIGGIAAILGATLWAAAGLVNAGLALGLGATLAPAFLVAGIPALLVALIGLSMFHARTNPTLSWVAFAVPAIGAVALLVGMGGIGLGGGEAFWLMFGLGSFTAFAGSGLFAIAMFRTSIESRFAAILIGAGCAVAGIALTSRGPQAVAAAGLAAFALGWFVLGVQALRLDRRPVAPPRPAS